MVCQTYNTTEAVACFDGLAQSTTSWAEYWVTVALIALAVTFLIELVVYFRIYK